MNVDFGPAISLASRYKFVLPVSPFRGLPGDHLAKGVGSSVEFQDFRHYVPGDDPRHIDWNAVGRTDQLIVRLHKEEVRLRVDLLLDSSRSMALGEGEKSGRAAQVSYLFTLLARRLGAQVTVWLLGDDAERVREGLDKRLADLRFEGRLSLPDLLNQNPFRLPVGSIRIVVSDFLFPHDPGRLFARIGQGAGAVAFLQILSKDERDPGEEGHVRFVDIETGEERQMVVRAEAVRGYRDRLQTLQEGLRTVCQAYHSPFVRLAAEESLESWCRGPLTEAGILTP